MRNAVKFGNEFGQLGGSCNNDDAIIVCILYIQYEETVSILTWNSWIPMDGYRCILVYPSQLFCSEAHDGQ